MQLRVLIADSFDKYYKHNLKFYCLLSRLYDFKASCWSDDAPEVVNCTSGKSFCLWCLNDDCNANFNYMRNNLIAEEG